jgi:hypothetical protein
LFTASEVSVLCGLWWVLGDVGVGVLLGGGGGGVRVRGDNTAQGHGWDLPAAAPPRRRTARAGCTGSRPTRSAVRTLRWPRRRRGCTRAGGPRAGAAGRRRRRSARGGRRLSRFMSAACSWLVLLCIWASGRDVGVVAEIAGRGDKQSSLDPI